MSEFRAMGVIYLASPYSRYRHGLWQAYKDIAQIGGRLIAKGATILCPVTHSHPLAIYGGIDPLDHSIWLPFNQTMMEAAECLVVAKMDGWKESKGIAHEIEWFKGQGKPVYYLDPVTLEVGDEP